MKSQNYLNTALATWIKEARKFSGMTQEQLGDIINRSKQNVYSMEQGKHEPSYPQLVAIAKATQFPKPFPGLEDVSNIHFLNPLELTDFDNAVFIKIKNVSASMGNGATQPDTEQVIDNMVLSKDWIRKELNNISSINNLQIIAGIGDSMSPTYESGDLLLVDTGYNTFQSDSIYVFTYDGGIYAKRVMIDPVSKTIHVTSDNPNVKAWNPIPLSQANEFLVHGRIVYAWCGKKV